MRTLAGTEKLSKRKRECAINFSHQLAYSNRPERTSDLQWVFYSEYKFSTKIPRGGAAKRMAVIMGWAYKSVPHIHRGEPLSPDIYDLLGVPRPKKK